jgi:hypothetical protein
VTTGEMLMDAQCPTGCLVNVRLLEAFFEYNRLIGKRLRIVRWPGSRAAADLAGGAAIPQVAGSA